MRILLSSLCLILGFGQAHATAIVHNDFSDTSLLSLNGSAATTVTPDGTVLRLTPAAQGQSGSAFSLETLNTDAFSTYFSFRITSPGGPVFDCNSDSGADGIVFVAQNVSSSIGGAGSGIGYQGIPNSIGIEFDTWCNSFNNDPNSNHIAVNANGNVNHGPGAPNAVPFATRFDDGNIWHAWIDYDGSQFEVRANQTGVRDVNPAISFDNINLSALIGSTQAYVGFTSGTGADFGNHDILAWEYRDFFNPIQVPVPSTAWLLLSFIGYLGWKRRKTDI